MGKHGRWVEDDGTVNWPEHDEDDARDSLIPVPPIVVPTKPAKEDS